MSTHILPAHGQQEQPTWLRRLGLSVVLFIGCCIAFLPFAFYPLIPADVRPFLWSATTAALLALALLARRSQRFHTYWVAIYAMFVASTANLADWYLNDWLPGLFGIPTRSPAGNGLALLESTLVISVCILVLIKLAGGDLGSLLLRRGKVRWWLPIGIAGFAFFALTVIPAATGLFQGQDLTLERMLPWLPWVLLFVLSNGVREELLFRGLLLPRFGPLIGGVPAILVTSLIFSLAHVSVTYTPDILFFLGITFVLGAIFGTVAYKTDSLWGAVLIHAGADIPVVVGIFSTMT